MHDHSKQEITACKIILWAIMLMAAAYAGSAVHAQLCPPPPVFPAGSVDGFNKGDRDELHSIFLLTRSIRARLFPQQEEDRVLNLLES